MATAPLHLSLKRKVLLTSLTQAVSSERLLGCAGAGWAQPLGQAGGGCWLPASPVWFLFTPSEPKGRNTCMLGAHGACAPALAGGSLLLCTGTMHALHPPGHPTASLLRGSPGVAGNSTARSCCFLALALCE